MATDRPAIGVDSDLLNLIGKADSRHELQRGLFDVMVAQVEATDRVMAQVLRLGTIPRRLDPEIIGVLRNEPFDDETNDRLARELPQLSFVTPRDDGTLAYHDAVREAVLERWLDGPDRDVFEEVNQRLVGLYEARHERMEAEALHLERVTDLLRRANADRYLDIAARLEGDLVGSLLDALYHATLQSATVGQRSLSRYVESYLRKHRLRMCRTMVVAARSNFRRLAREEDHAVPLAWVRYWSARIATAERAPARAERILRDLLAAEPPDERLALWARADLGDAIEQQDRLDEAEPELSKALDIAERTGIDAWNLPVWQSKVASLHWTLQRNHVAVDGFRQMVRTADEQGNHRLRAHGRLSLAATLRSIGKWDQGFHTALEGLHVARTHLSADRVLQARVAETFLGFHAGDVGWAEMLIVEAETLLPGAAARPRLELLTRALGIFSDQGCVRLGDQVASKLIGDGKHDSAAQEPEALVALAGLRFAEGRIDKAIELCEESITRVEPGATDARYAEAVALTNLAMLQGEAGELAAALETAEQAGETWRSMGHHVFQAVAQTFAADALRRAGRWDEAEQRLKDSEPLLADAAPEHHATWLSALGDLLHARGELADAAILFERARGIGAKVRDERSEAKCLVRLVDVHTASSRWDDANHAARRLAKLTARLSALQAYTPSNQRLEADQQNARGMEHFTRATDSRPHDVAQARDFFRSAARNAPESPWPALNLAYACAELGEWDDAQKALSAVVSFGSPWTHAAELVADDWPSAA